MAEEIKQQKESRESESNKKVVGADEVKSETKTEEKKEKTESKKTIMKKEEAVARGVSVHLSKKHGMYICSFIKGKKIDQAITELSEVIKLKRAIPFKGEIPHRKGMMSGRYPINASKIFIQLLKALKGNSIVNQMDLDKTRIYFAHSTFASRPSRRLGKAKRTHITLKAKEYNTQKETKEIKK
jgi:large subunit ribosomal protein L22